MNNEQRILSPIVSYFNFLEDEEVRQQFLTSVNPAPANQQGPAPTLVPNVNVADNKEEDDEVDNLNSSIVSASSLLDDDEPVPSSQAERIINNNPPPPILPNTLNLEVSPGLHMNLKELDKSCNAANFYNNPKDESIFLETILFSYIAMTMVSNLLHWVEQTSPSLVHCQWFRAYGFRRLFMEALEQALSRLPFPRIFNVFDPFQWISAALKQSSKVKLLLYPWLTHPQPNPYSYKQYQPISTYWSMSQREGAFGFIFGAKNNLPPLSKGSSNWLTTYWKTLPLRCLKLVQQSLPGLSFELDIISVFDLTTHLSTSSLPGYWAVDYSAMVLLPRDPNYDYHVVVLPITEPLVSLPGLSNLLQDQLVLPYIPCDLSPLPTFHLQPNLSPFVPPYLHNVIYPPFTSHPGFHPNQTFNLMPTALGDQVEEHELKLDKQEKRLHAVEQLIPLADSHEDLIRQLERDCDVTDRLVESLSLDYGPLSKRIATLESQLSSLQSLADRVQQLEIDNVPIPLPPATRSHRKPPKS